MNDLDVKYLKERVSELDAKSTIFPLEIAHLYLLLAILERRDRVERIILS